MLITAIRNLVPKVVHFPTTTSDWNKIEEGFYRKQGFPGVVGAIDGSLIEIERPKIFDGFYCRKGFTALNVQAIVDADKKFLSFDIRPGSWSDKKTYSASFAGKKICKILPTGCHLLGDAGYTLSPFLLTPFTDPFLSKKQKKYNFLHSSSRMSVECAFGLWKGRFRILCKKMNEKSIEKTGDIIAATIVLHNLLILMEDDTTVEIFEEPITMCTEEEEEIDNNKYDGNDKNIYMEK